jgi:hypothetical protein
MTLRTIAPGDTIPNDELPDYAQTMRKLSNLQPVR